MTETVVTVTSKGQATIPKKLRQKHGIERKAVVVDTKEGVLLKPIQGPAAEKGSLKKIFGGKTSKDIVEEARLEEARKEKKLPRRGGG